MTGTYRHPRLILHVGLNGAHQIFTVANTDEMRDLKVRHVGKFIEVTGPDSLTEVPLPTMLAIFNTTRGDKPLDRFRDRNTADRRVFEIIAGLATPYQLQESLVSDETKEAKQGKKKGGKKAPQAEGAEGSAPAVEKAKTPGVIGTVRELIDRPEGASIEEIAQECHKRFPDRDIDGMRSTAKIQSSRLAKSTGRTINSYLVKDRGRVYRFADVKLPSTLEEVQAEEKPAKTTKAQKEVQEESAQTASV